MEASCLELALEGERLCKAGDCRAGVSFFEAAVQVGTEDLKTLSAIYSQLGNAYFYLHEYAKALEYHHHDLTLARTIGDQLGEAKASGNLGNTLKVLGNYEEAIVCCQRHLDISRDLSDKVGEARALYNLGNVHHSKGKSVACAGTHDPGEFPEDVKVALRKAAEYYEENLKIVTELGDRAAQGRAYGNLGNTHYLLGNFRSAVIAHEQQAQLSCVDQGNCTNSNILWSLVPVGFTIKLSTTSSPKYYFSEKIFIQIVITSWGDSSLIFQKNKVQDWNSEILAKQKQLVSKPSAKLHFVNRLKGKKYKNITSKVLQDASNSIDHRLSSQKKSNSDVPGDEGFFDLLSRFQSNRMDDQRYCFQDRNRLTATVSSTPSRTMKKSFSISVVSPHTDEFLDLLVSSQSRRLDDQRASASNLPGLRLNQHNSQSVLGRLMSSNNGEPDDDFFDILVKCQGSRLDDQRCAPPPNITKGPTVPDDDFFSLILRSQGKRMDEQRVLLPSGLKRPNST
ncbi:hypothetical protein JD844_017474 [Phrynosoma platyrhinos]|uniref:G-protein-signaling modulator 2 n=1 Tax=Phrynosoma platyrhinos TaxID=52577 RepID=A0ABQ7SM07_PHRPL|nr:hypothetical protein JD844_017474 [Phrynosoma platyrhinos]